MWSANTLSISTWGDRPFCRADHGLWRHTSDARRSHSPTALLNSYRSSYAATGSERRVVIGTPPPLRFDTSRKEPFSTWSASKFSPAKLDSKLTASYHGEAAPPRLWGTTAAGPVVISQRLTRALSHHRADPSYLDSQKYARPGGGGGPPPVARSHTPRPGGEWYGPMQSYDRGLTPPMHSPMMHKPAMNSPIRHKPLYKHNGSLLPHYSLETRL